MFYRIIFCLVVVALTSCTTAKMAVYPGLELNSVKYKITSMPNFLSGGDMVFGPYRAAKISRSAIRGYKGGLFTTKETKEQNYTYQFIGKSTWNAVCGAEKGKTSIGRVSGELYANLTCIFSPVKNKTTSAKNWKFKFSGETASRASAKIKMGSKTIIVNATNELKGSPLALGKNTGYYFYLGGKIIAGIDAISKEGPVWLNNKLSSHEKDMISMTMVALLLNQTN